MEIPADGRAVAYVRSILEQQGVRSDHAWRATVVPAEQEGWVVRTWTQTPPSQPRPVGRPQFVHRVVLDSDGPEGLQAELVWSLPRD